MTRARPARRQRGFSLMELMVAVTIGMVVTLAVTSLLVSSEGSKRTIGALNDTSQNGAYTAYVLDRTLRSSGSGFARAVDQPPGADPAMGCLIAAANGGGALLPRPGAAPLPAPFAGLSTSPVRLAPVVIHQGAATNGDVLTVMTGAAGKSETPFRIDNTAADRLILPNTLTLRANDLVLVAEGRGTCLVEQVANTFTNSTQIDVPLMLGGAYYQTTINGKSVADFGTGNAQAFALGNVTGGQPQLQLIGVGANQTLFSYDLLQLAGRDASVPLADGVLTLRALYGIDTNGDRLLDSWVEPTGTQWGDAALLDGSDVAQGRLRQIVAVRIGLVMQTSLIDKKQVAPASVDLFADLGNLKQTVAIADRNRQVRLIETTVPLRNFLP